MPNLIYRIDEVTERLDEIDDEIRAKYPEIENAWLHQTIAEKVKLEIEFSNLKNHK